ncbi:DMT family transporter [Foetidibacter luteolus]|uniref:DMT family transporter n=1 Tax=Foetidibacter luteolus TaxID=2608880 RepID=UPI00129B34F4|nr:multidrug resistance efflux transporter family protein [Foetidibacter luteolus]
MVHVKRIFQATALGILSNFFLSAGLVVNSVMAFKGNSWAWTASLRYLLLIPFLAGILAARRQLKSFLSTFMRMPGVFLLWGSIGYGLFYALLVYAAELSPGWLAAAAFETTIVAGLLLSPFIYKDSRKVIPYKALLLSVFLVSSLLIMQMERLKATENPATIIAGILPALAAAFLWPLGNRKLLLALEQKQIRMNAMQRVLGMALGSLPVSLLTSLYGYFSSGLPGRVQVLSSLCAAFFSGVLGTGLFYKAMQMVKHNPIAMATVEATQVTAIVFTLLGEMLFTKAAWPGLYGNIGFAVMAAGIAMYISLSVRYERA